MTIKNKRLGMVRISEKFRRDAANTGHGANLFIGAVVLAIDEDWMSGLATYKMWHPQFDPIDEGQVLPEYEAEFAPGEIAPTWKRVDHAGRKP